MIYTVTFNPSLDYIMYIPALVPGKIIRSQREQIFPGGKGVNVSIVLSRLGIPNRAWGFVAGFTGAALESMLAESGVVTDFIPLEEGNTRINVKFKDRGESAVNGQGPDIPSQALSKLFRKLEDLQAGDTLILAGSIPDSLPADIYEQIFHRVSGKGVLCVVDAVGPLLKNTFRHHPFLIKPNSNELGKLFSVRLKEKEDIVRFAQKAIDLGARNVLVSLEEKGAVLVTEDGQVLECPARKGTVVNSVGAGDSMVAGFLTGWYKTGDYLRALQFGVAAGSASAFQEWLAEKEDIFNLLDEPAVFK